MKLTVLLVILSIIWSSATAPVCAQEPPHDVNALAKETENRVGSLISVPFQFNFNTGGDLEDRAFFNLNFQPVIPFKATANWNLIARTIVPVNSFPGSRGHAIQRRRRHPGTTLHHASQMRLNRFHWPAGYLMCHLLAASPDDVSSALARQAPIVVVERRLSL